MEGNGQSEWHSIRPWSPRLALSVREITSVSATFILSSSLSEPPNGSSSGTQHPPDGTLSSLELTIDDSENGPSDDPESSDSDVNGSEAAPRELIISNALARGLSVNVNGSPWQRVLIRIDDKADEAVIIIYGLMPGRQYDIDLGLVQGGPGGVNLRRQVVTEEDSDRTNAGTNTDHDLLASNDMAPESSTMTQPSTTLTHIALPTPPQSPSPTTHPTSHVSVEERAAQLRQTLAIVHDERATLTASLKTARRDAQKADGALRSQIDTLRRASEKNTAAENRARQKVLALQEAVKRAQTATSEMEELVREVESVLPALQAERREKERVYNSVFAEAERTRKEMERETENARKKAERGEAELSALNNRLERINGKREKLEGEGGTIQDLEEELKRIQEEIEKAEMDSYVYRASDALQHGVIDGYPYMGPNAFPQYEGMDDGSDPHGDEGDLWEHRFSYLPPQVRMNSQPQAPPPGLAFGTIGRPPPAPIGRPASSHVPLSIGSTSAAATASPSTFAPSTGKRSNRNSLDPPFVFQPPPAQPTPGAIKSPQQQRSPPVSSPSGSGTTLSGKAPPFEPSRGVAQAVRAAVGTSPTQPTQVLRPGAGASGTGAGAGGRRRSNSRWGKAGGSGDGHSGK